MLKYKEYVYKKHINLLCNSTDDFLNIKMQDIFTNKISKEVSIFFVLMSFVFLSFLNPNITEAAVLSPGNISSCGELASPGLYTLTQSVSNGTTTCFTVSSDNVIINGGGFTVSGSGTTSVAIDARARTGGPTGALTEGSNAYTNLIVNNLNITGYATGANLSGNADSSGSGVKNGNGGDAGDVYFFFSSIGSVTAGGGNSTSKTYGGIGGNISFKNTNLDISSSTMSALGGTGTSGRNTDGGLSLTYSGTLTKTSLVLSSLSFLNDNSVNYGVYVGGTWPILPGNISTCGTLYGPGTFTLTGNISGITGTCFTASTNNITLNGAGYSITSATTTNANFAINTLNLSSTTIDSLTVTNFSKLVTSSSSIILSGSSLNLSNKFITANSILINAGTLNIATTSFSANFMDINYSTSVTGTSTATSTALMNLKINNLDYGVRNAGLIFSETWVARATDTARSWYSIASSADGTKLAAVVYNGYIYTSTDSGATWATSTSAGSKYWYSITSSADGTKLAAVDNNSGYIYTSTDSGATWIQRTSSGQRYWTSITSSTDGTKLAAVDNNTGYIYTSVDSGVTWTAQISSGSRYWYSITSSADGSKFAAVVGGSSYGYIYTSTDSGNSWVQKTSDTTRRWYSITSSADGTKLAAVEYNGYVYTSTTSGATWTARTTAGSRQWYSITSSADGTKLAAVAYGGYIYASTDGGITWVQKTFDATRNWTSITSSSDGTKLFSGVNSNYLYTYSTFSPTLSVDIILPQVNSNVSIWNPTTSWGVSKNCYYSYDNFVSTSTANCLLNGSDIATPPYGNVTLYLKGISNMGANVTTSVTFNNYSSQSILINRPVANTVYSASTWRPSVNYSTTNANLTLCQYSYNNWVSTTTADCSKNGIDILPPSDGLNTLYIRTVDSNNNINFSTIANFTYLSNWTAQASSATGEWKDIASSADGTKLAAVMQTSGYIYTSTTSGTTWVQRTSVGAGNWKAITSSDDGTKLAAVLNSGAIYTSTTSGATWVARAIPSGVFSDIASSADGTKLVANGNGYIYISTDSGATWASSTSAGSRQWNAVTSSDDGIKLAAAVLSGYIYTSTDSGLNWVMSTSSGSKQWKSIDSDSTGTKLVAAETNGGYIYTSVDGGTTWTVRITSGIRNWYAVASSADGTKLAAVVNGGYIYTSADGGVSWNERDSSRAWYSIASDSTGTKLAAIVNNGNVYTLNFSSFDSYINTQAVSIGSPIAASSLNSQSWFPSINWGFNKSSCYYSYNNFTSTSTANCSLNGTDILAPLVDGANTLYLKAFDLLNNISSSSVAFTYYASAWITRDVSVRQWQTLASSADGTKLAGSVSYPGYTSNYVYTSTDSGITWAAKANAGNLYWTSISSSANGNKLLAGTYNNYLTTSADSGATWSQVTSAGIRYWPSVTSSADGTKLAAVASGGNIWLSTDSGVTWATSSSAGVRPWNYITASSDGNNLAALAGDGNVLTYIYLSHDSGATWATSTDAGSKYWRAIASSADGTKLVAVVGSGGNGQIYTSTTSGATWVARDSSRDWRSVASSADGTKLVAGANGYIYISTDSGVTWVSHPSAGSRTWNAITSSADGNKLAAAFWNGNIYTYTPSTQTLSVDLLLPQTGSSLSSWSPIVSWGTATLCYYSYDNFVSTSTANCALKGADISAPTLSGSNTIYIKGIDAGAVVKTNSATFTYSPHYWCGTADSNWTNVNNWYTDATCTVGKGSIPGTTSVAFLVGTTSPIISTSTTTIPLYINSTGLTGAANTSGIIFSNTTVNTSRIIGNVTFNNTAYNTGAITGNAIFATGASGTFTLSGSMIWGGTISGTIKGGDGVNITHLIFNNSSSNTTTIPSNISNVFNDSASNNGIINGDATFNNTGLFTMGTVNGTSTLNGLSQTLNGVNNVINLVKRVATSIRDTLYLVAGSTLNISGMATILGYDDNNLLTIRSTTPGVYANLGVNGTSSMNFLRLKDIHNTGATLDLSPKTVFDDLGNSGITFRASSSVSSRNGFTSLYTQGSDPVFPGSISSCVSIYFAGTYTLSQDITGDCNIAVAGVTLNGAGHTLNGNLTTSSYGVTVSNINVTGLMTSSATTTINGSSHLNGGLTTTGVVAGDGSSFVGSSTINAGAYVSTSSIIFTGDILNNGTIYSGNIISGKTTNNGLINGNFIANASSTNNGVINGNLMLNSNSINSGTVNGNLVVNDSAINAGTVTGTARFNNLISTSGTVSFSGTTTFPGVGTIAGDIYDSTGSTMVTTWAFNGTSTNTGILKGNAIFNNTSINMGTITGNADVYSPVTRPIGGVINGRLAYHGYPVIYFNDTAAGHGVTGKWDDALNWWANASSTIHALIVPTAGDDITVYGNITKSSSTAYANSAVFEGNSNNGITLTLTSTSSDAAFFKASSTNSGTIVGNATFYGPDSDTSGTVTGTVTRLYDAGIYIISRDFVSNGIHWIVQGINGASIDLSGSIYSLVNTTFKAFNNTVFIWNLLIGKGAPELAINYPTNGVNIKWQPSVSWDTNYLVQYQMDGGAWVRASSTMNGKDIPRPTAGDHILQVMSVDPDWNTTHKVVYFTYDNTQPVWTSCGTDLLDEATRPYYYLTGDVNVDCIATATTTIKGDDGLGHLYVLNGNLTGSGLGINIQNMNITGTTSSFGDMTIASSTLSGTVDVFKSLVSDSYSSFGNTIVESGATIHNGNFVGNLINNGRVINSTTSPSMVSGSTINNGIIDGNFVFNANSINTGTVAGDAILNSSSTNTGTITGDALFSHLNSTSGVVTFSGDRSFAGTGHVIGNVKDLASTTITTWVFNDTSKNIGFTKGNAFFNGSSSNSITGTIFGNAHFNNLSTNLGTVDGDADVYYAVATPLTGTVTGTTRYHSYPNTTAFKDVTGDGVWNNILNWFTDTTFGKNLDRLPNTNEAVVIFASTTLGSNTTNNVYIGTNDITINGLGHTLTGEISGNGAYDGGDAFDFNLANIIVMGTTTANGADNSDGIGGNGGDINISTSTTGSVVANGGNGTLGGGIGGSINVTNSLGNSKDLNNQAVGGNATYCGNGGNSGNITSISSSYGTITNNAGNGTNVGCPSENHGSGSYVVPVVVGIYVPPATPRASNNTPSGGTGGGGTLLNINLNNLGNLNMGNLSKMGLASEDLGISKFVNPLADLIRLKPLDNLAPLPLLDWSVYYDKFLNKSLAAPLADLSRSVPSIKKELTSANIRNGYDLYMMKESPIDTPTLSDLTKDKTKQPENLIFVSVDGKEAPTKLSIDKKGGVYQMIAVSPYDVLTISTKNTNKTIPKATWNGIGVKTAKDKNNIVKLSITAPKDAGVYTLKVGTLTLNIAVEKPATTSTGGVTTPTTQTPQKKLSPIQKLWSWFGK